MNHDDVMRRIIALPKEPAPPGFTWTEWFLYESMFQAPQVHRHIYGPMIDGRPLHDLVVLSLDELSVGATAHLTAIQRQEIVCLSMVEKLLDAGMTLA